MPPSWPHKRINGLLEADLHAELLAWTLKNESAFTASTINYGEAGGEVRRSLSAAIAKPIADRLGAQMTRHLPDIFTALGVPPFEYLVEVELVAYGHGARFGRHADVRPNVADDKGRPRIDRRVSAVYYFHRSPKAFSGGQLRLHPLMGGEVIDIEPEQNMLVAFPSFVPHEVLPVHCPSGHFADSRFAINFWVHPMTSVAKIAAGPSISAAWDPRWLAVPKIRADIGSLACNDIQAIPVRLTYREDGFCARRTHRCVLPMSR